MALSSMSLSLPELAVSAINTLGQRINALTARLQPFTGTPDVRDWLDDFERYTDDVGRHTDIDRLNCLINFLDGNAKDWYRLQNIRSFGELKDKLLKRYDLSSMEKFSRRSAIFELKQAPNDTFREYAEQLMTLAREADFDDTKVILETLIYGARPAIKPYLLAANPSSIDSLLDLPVVRDEATLLPHDARTDATLEHVSNMLETLQHGIAATYDARAPRARATSLPRSRRQATSCSPSRRRHRSCSRPTHCRPSVQMHQPRQRHPGPAPMQRKNCGKCGLSKCQENTRCYAFNRRCFKCQGWHHLARCCHAKQKRRQPQ